MAYKRAELVLHDGLSAEVIAWVELPEEDTNRCVKLINSWFNYMAKVTYCPPGARLKVRFDYMRNLIPKPREQKR